jgi:hypothetical protein
MTKHLTIDINKLLLWYFYIKLSESSTTESCQSNVYSDVSDIGFGWLNHLLTLLMVCRLT